MANAEIRAILKNEKIPFWKIADKFGVHENTILRRMRHELSKAEKQTFLKAINEIIAEKKTV